MGPIETSSGAAHHRRLVALAGYDAGRVVIWLRGQHDISTVPALTEAMTRAIELGDTDLVVDLRGVDFMSAATVGVIIRARTCLRTRARALTLRAPSARAQRVLDLCGLDVLVERRPAAELVGVGVAGPADQGDGRCHPPPA